MLAAAALPGQEAFVRENCCHLHNPVSFSSSPIPHSNRPYQRVHKAFTGSHSGVFLSYFASGAPVCTL